MGNCAARPYVREGSDVRTQLGVTAKKNRHRRSSLGRFADFLTQQSSVIRDAVSEKLPTAANRGSQEVINLVEGPGYLEPSVWCAGLDVPVVKARATALEKAIDALLNPVLEALEELLNGRAAEMGRGQMCYWHTASLKEILFLLPTASRMHNGVGLTSLSHAFGSMLTVVHALSQAATDAELPVPPEIFHVASLNRLLDFIGTVAAKHAAAESAEAGQRRWQDWESIKKTLCLEEEKVLVTLGAQSKALLLWMHGGISGRPSVQFQVRRDRAFLDAFQQAEAMELLQTSVGGCIIETSFVDSLSSYPGAIEAGSFGRGPEKEFFLLAGQAIVEQPAGSPLLLEAERDKAGHQQQPLFSYNKWAARYWFNAKLKQSGELRAQYTFAGWLLGQSFCNRATLGAAFPELLFSKLLLGSNFRATLEVLQEFDVEAAAGVRGAAALKEADWKELLAAEGLDPQMKRRAYIKHAVQRLLVHDVSWQFAAFAQGFFTAIDYKALLRWGLTAADLEDWASWAPSADDLRIDQLYRVILDPKMQITSPRLGPAVLEVVNAWPPRKRRQFAQFVTGASRPCLPQMELLRISMPFVARDLEEGPRILGMLPQAHTCENILELPDYWSALLSSDDIVRTLEDPTHPLDLDGELHKLIDERLSTAVAFCGSYELSGPPSTGIVDLPVTRPEKAAAAGSKIPLRPSATEITADATSKTAATLQTPVRQRITSHPVEVTPSPQPSSHSIKRGSQNESRFAAPTRIPKVGVEEAENKQQSQAVKKPVSKAVTRTKQMLDSFPDRKMVQPQQSSSPLSPGESIMAHRL